MFAGGVGGLVFRGARVEPGRRDSKFPGLFDAVLKDAGVEVVLSEIRMPRMNAIMERWVRPAVVRCWTGR